MKTRSPAKIDDFVIVMEIAAVANPIINKSTTIDIPLLDLGGNPLKKIQYIIQRGVTMKITKIINQGLETTASLEKLAAQRFGSEIENAIVSAGLETVSSDSLARMIVAAMSVLAEIGSHPEIEKVILDLVNKAKSENQIMQGEISPADASWIGQKVWADFLAQMRALNLPQTINRLDFNVMLKNILSNFNAKQPEMRNQLQKQMPRKPFEQSAPQPAPIPAPSRPRSMKPFEA